MRMRVHGDVAPALIKAPLQRFEIHLVRSSPDRLLKEQLACPDIDEHGSLEAIHAAALTHGDTGRVGGNVGGTRDAVVAESLKEIAADDAGHGGS